MLLRTPGLAASVECFLLDSTFGSFGFGSRTGGILTTMEEFLPFCCRVSCWIVGKVHWMLFLWCYITVRMLIAIKPKKCFAILVDIIWLQHCLYHSVHTHHSDLKIKESTYNLRADFDLRGNSSSPNNSVALFKYDRGADWQILLMILPKFNWQSWSGVRADLMIIIRPPDGPTVWLEPKIKIISLLSPLKYKKRLAT